MDIKLHYIEKGDRDVLVLLHGNGESGEYFRSQIDHFSKKYRVIVPDTRGHGKSPRGESPFTIKQFADDLYEFLQSLNIERAILLGFSDGGNIALEFALSHPEAVEKLILNGANLYPQGLVAPLRIVNRAALALTSALSHVSPSMRRRAELLRLMTDQPHIDPEELKGLNIPTLVVAGSRDLIKREHTELIARSVPGARLCILPGTHTVAADSPDEFNRAVQEFLDM